MTACALDEAILHGLSLDAEWVSTASPDQLAPYADVLERIRDNLTWAFEKARKAKVPA